MTRLTTMLTLIFSMIGCDSDNAQPPLQIGLEQDSTVNVTDDGVEEVDALIPTCEATSNKIDIGQQLSLPTSGSVFAIIDIEIVNDGIVVMYYLEGDRYLRKFGRDGNPLTEPVNIFSDSDISGNLSNDGDELLVTGGIREQAYAGRVNASLSDPPRMQRLHDSVYRGQPVYGAYPFMTKQGDDLFVVWRDFRMEDASYGQTGFFYSFRGRHAEAGENFGAELYFTPREPNIAGFANLGAAAFMRIENGAFVYPAKKSGDYFIAWRDLSQNTGPLREANPILFARSNSKVDKAITASALGPIPAVAWIEEGTLRLQEGANEYSRGVQLSDSASFAQFVHTDQQRHLVWAEAMDEGFVWKTRMQGSTENVMHVEMAAGGEITHQRTRFINENTIESITVHEFDRIAYSSAGDRNELWLTTLCVNTP